MGKNSDPLHITQTEHSGVWGRHTASSGKSGLGAAAQGAPRASAPFDCCAITLQPWKNPVADPTDGTVYELTNIIPWIKKHAVSPATGRALKPAELLPLHFAQKEKHNAGAGATVWHDPVSFKTFNHATHLVAIRTTGNVFAFDTVQNLNIKVKYWQDLLTGEPFQRSDILTLQDPNKVRTQPAVDAQEIRDTMRAAQAGDGSSSNAPDEVNISATGSASTLIKKLKQQEVARQDAKSQAGQAAARKLEDMAAAATHSRDAIGSANHTEPTSSSGRSTGMTAASFTSTGLTPRTKTDREVITQEEAMYDAIRQGGKGKAPLKGYVRLVTNFGPLNLELHCDKAPKTCYNFLTLCRRGSYDQTVFHRNIPGFMVQGGDPTGSGRGGESMWGKPFADELGASGAFGHDGRGCLSMANRGPDTNGSQFFITFAAKRHLDKKHTVFGRLVDSPSAALDSIEKVPTDPATDKPLRTIRILDVQIFSDPFFDYQEREQRKAMRNDVSEVAKREEKRRKRDEDRTTWLGTNLNDKPGSDLRGGGGGASDQGRQSTSEHSAPLATVGRYLEGSASEARVASEQAGSRKRKGGSSNQSFGDFAGW
ncbi:unnamed protein product [Parajaminaea phylloscopi]